MDGKQVNVKKSSTMEEEGKEERKTEGRVGMKFCAMEKIGRKDGLYG